MDSHSEGATQISRETTCHNHEACLLVFQSLSDEINPGKHNNNMIHLQVGLRPRRAVNWQKSN